MDVISHTDQPQDERALPRLGDGSLRRLRPRLPEEDSSQRERPVTGGDPRHRGPAGHEHHRSLSRRRILQDHHQLAHNSWRGERQQGLLGHYVMKVSICFYLLW